VTTTPDEQRWFPPGARIDTGPVTMTREELEQGIADGTVHPTTAALADLRRWHNRDAHDQPQVGHRP
jgi:hypothetical protein